MKQESEEIKLNDNIIRIYVHLCTHTLTHTSICFHSSLRIHRNSLYDKSYLRLSLTLFVKLYKVRWSINCHQIYTFPAGEKGPISILLSARNKKENTPSPNILQ